MTVSNSNNPKTYILELCFAAEQITESLQFCFYDEKGNRCEQLAHGPLASTFNFQKGDRIDVKVMASAENTPGKRKMPGFSMNIINCSLVSIPELDVDDISMFDPTNAVTNLPGTDWISSPMIEDPVNNRVTIESNLRESLTVTAKNGQWKMSGYLSISQIYNGKKSNKLYYFDPEGSTGVGWGPP